MKRLVALDCFEPFLAPKAGLMVSTPIDVLSIAPPPPSPPPPPLPPVPYRRRRYIAAVPPCRAAYRAAAAQSASRLIGREAHGDAGEHGAAVVDQSCSLGGAAAPGPTISAGAGVTISTGIVNAGAAAAVTADSI